MSKKEWTIVALPDGDLNQAREVIRFLDHREASATNIASPTSESDDSVKTNINNEAIVTHQRKRRPQMVLDFSRLRWQDALRLRQLESQERRVYFCPNVEEATVWMQPLLGNWTEFLRRETPPSVGPADNVGWVWDDVRKTFYRQTLWARSRAGASPFHLDSPYGICSRPSVNAFNNRAAEPVPTSTATGWTIDGVSGGTIEYDNETRLPEAGDPDNSSTSGGVTAIESDGATGIFFAAYHSGSSLPADEDICAAVLVRTNDPNWQAQLQDATSSAIETKDVTPGDWQLIKLQGAQSGGGTTARVVLINDEGDDRKATIQVGTVFISTMPEDFSAVSGDWPFPDFVLGTQEAQLYSQSEGPVLSGGWTVSIAVQHKDRTYPIVYLGSSPDSLQVRRVDPSDWIGVTVGGSNTEGNTTAKTLSSLGVEDGDWYLLTIVNGSDGIRSYINGQLASAAPSGIVSCGTIDDTKYVGNSPTVTRWAENQGFALFRIDAVAWSAERVLRHYNTYLAPSGVAYVAPTIGWRFYIASFDYEPYNMDDGNLVVRGRLVLEGTKADPEFRTLHPDLMSNNDG